MNTNPVKKHIERTRASATMMAERRDPYVKRKASVDPNQDGDP